MIVWNGAGGSLECVGEGWRIEVDSSSQSAHYLYGNVVNIFHIVKTGKEMQSAEVSEWSGMCLPATTDGSE